jgi:enoyl-CoA hydratase
LSASGRPDGRDFGPRGAGVEAPVIDLEVVDSIAVIRVDDGKRNALSTAAIAQLGATMGQAGEQGCAATVILGREGAFSAGFDLAEVRESEESRERLRRAFVDLLIGLFETAQPVVIGCTGHAMAAGAALLVAADRRIGASGPFRVGFNEAAAGVTISGVTVELARYRMPMPYFESLVTGDLFDPDSAVAAGLLDEVVDPGQVEERARAEAERLASVPAHAFAAMKTTVRRPVIALMREAQRAL